MSPTRAAPDDAYDQQGQSNLSGKPSKFHCFHQLGSFLHVLLVGSRGAQESVCLCLCSFESFFVFFCICLYLCLWLYFCVIVCVFGCVFVRLYFMCLWFPSTKFWAWPIIGKNSCAGSYFGNNSGRRTVASKTQYLLFYNLYIY